MNWSARLSGHDFDLETLAEAFGVGEPKVSRDADGNYILESAEFDDCATAVEVKERAEGLLLRMNGAARAMDLTFRPVSLDGYFKNAIGLHAIVVGGTVTARGKAYAAVVTGVTTAPLPAPAASAWTTLAKASTNVDDALRLLSAAELDWVTLYKLFEIVKHDVGGANAIAHAGWATNAQLSAFTASANRPDVSGDGARHARLPGGPPKKVLALADARQLVQHLVKSWLDAMTRGSP